MEKDQGKKKSKRGRPTKNSQNTQDQTLLDSYLDGLEETAGAFVKSRLIPRSPLTDKNQTQNKEAAGGKSMENESVEEKEVKEDGEIDTKEEVGQQEETVDKQGAKASEKGEKTADEVEEAERSVSQEALSAPDSADTVDTNANATAGEGEGTQVAERSAEHGSENGTCKHCRCCVSTGTIESKIE